MGSNPDTARSFRLELKVTPEGRVFDLPVTIWPPLSPHVAEGVGIIPTMGDEPHSISSVWRIDGTSRNKIRLHLVALILQISAHLLEDQSVRPINNAENIFDHDPTRGKLAYCSQHFRPEVAVIVSSFPLSCKAKWLAGESSREDIHPPPKRSKVCCLDVFILNCIGKVVR